MNKTIFGDFFSSFRDKEYFFPKKISSHIFFEKKFSLNFSFCQFFSERICEEGRNFFGKKKLEKFLERRI